MNGESGHEVNERATIHEQQRKREREREQSEPSSPTKKRLRECEGEECELSSHRSENKRGDIEGDCSKCETRMSDHSEDEFEKPLALSDQMGLLLKVRGADSVDSLDGESVQSTENLSSCDVSLGFNETECESLESSLVCVGNSLDDISGSVLGNDKDKNEEEVICGTSHKKKKKKRKNKRKVKGDQDEGESKCLVNIRPNYFVGVQVSDSEIHKSIIKVQEELVAYEPALLRALVDVATSHITLLIARIDDEEALSVAFSALEDFSKDVQKEMTDQPIQLTFSGTDNFSKSVLYARVVEDEHHQRLLDLSDRLRQAFTEKGVFMPNMKPLNPHLTIAKMSKAPRGKGKPGPRKIEPMGYANYKDLHFGCQQVKSFQLLSMNSPKDNNRYYYCCKEITFGKDVIENTEDHMQCCFPRRPVMSTQHRCPFSTETSEVPSNVLASSVGYATALAASLMIVYVVGKVSGKL